MFQFIQKIWKHCFCEKPRVKVTRGFLKILDCFLRNQERWLSGADVIDPLPNKHDFYEKLSVFISVKPQSNIFALWLFWL